MEVQAAGKRRVLSAGFIDRRLMRFVQPLLKVYLRRDRVFRYNGMTLRIRKSVFHPRFFFSSKFIAAFAASLPVKGKSVCEMGAGSGLLSFTLLEKGARVTAVDINKAAVGGLRENLQRNFPGQTMQIIESDVFSNVPSQTFDYIFVNPPYFFREASDESELAWHCGAEGQFFARFFSEVKRYMHAHTQVYMCLADNCEIARIATYASARGLGLGQNYSRKIRWEMNYIYRVSPLERS